MSTFESAPRDHQSLTAALEKRLLLYLAARLPARVNSDHLTALGFVALVAAGAAYAAARAYPKAGLTVAIACLLLNWFGDSLDGTLARLRHLERPRYGFYVDHILDSVGSAALFLGLALSGVMSPAIALPLLVVYLLLSIETFLATYALGRFRLAFAGFGPTELRLLLIAGNLFALRNPIAHLFHRPFLLFDLGGACAILGMSVILLYSTAAHTRQLYRQETRW